MRQLPVGFFWLFLLLFAHSVSLPGRAQSVTGPAPVNFGDVNVCPGKQSSPKPCTRMTTLTFDVTAATTFGATQVVTQGLPDLDFTLSKTTCVGTLQAGASCTVKARFAPTTAGMRVGGIILTDSSGNPLATALLYGIGQAPMASFNPAPQITLPITGIDSASHANDLAIDAAGNAYVVVDNDIVKVDPLTGVRTTIARAPTARFLALDGAGDIFVSCPGDGLCGVTKIAAISRIQTTVGTGLRSDEGVALDGMGNLFVADQSQKYPRLLKISLITGSEVALIGGDSFPGQPVCGAPEGVAVDANDNAFIACFAGGPLFEYTDQGNVVPFNQFLLPYAVSVDAAGDLFCNCYIYPGVTEVAAGTGTETQVGTSGVDGPIALDGKGNLFETGYNELLEIESSEPAAFNFGTVAVGSTSAAQSITIQNVGNTTLNAVSPGLAISAGFKQVPGSGAPADCTASFSLAPGTSCNVSIVFAPNATGTIAGKATFTDTALNTHPSATQIMQLSGVGQ
ncbi:MAG: choice-of-anchor D domain-containing protein [Mycobacterium sp.]